MPRDIKCQSDFSHLGMCWESEVSLWSQWILRCQSSHTITNILTVFALFFFTNIFVLPRKQKLDKFSIYSNKFFHNLPMSESSFTCARLRASGLARRLQSSTLAVVPVAHGQWKLIRTSDFCQIFSIESI